MNATAPRSNRLQAYDRLLIEAGSVIANMNAPIFRRAAAREVAALFLPGPPDVSAGKTGAARALRECIIALASATNADSRNQIANAIGSLAAALRAEPLQVPEPSRIAAGEPRQYWIGRD